MVVLGFFIGECASQEPIHGHELSLANRIIKKKGDGHFICPSLFLCTERIENDTNNFQYIMEVFR